MAEVEEGKTPPRISCNAFAHPGNLIAFKVGINLITTRALFFNSAPKYHWKRLDSHEVLSSVQALTFTKGLNRTDKGVYVCIAENKHGSSVANIIMNILCE